MQNFREFVKDLFTLRTVWIDRGGGKWTVRKRLHPLLRSLCWTLALIVCAGVYSSMNNVRPREAVAEAEIITAKLPEPEKIPEPEVPPVKQTEEQQSIIIPLKNTTAKHHDIILPSEVNPDTDRIIKQPEKLTAPVPSVKPKKAANNGKYHIYINKSAYELMLFKGDELVKVYGIAIGKNPGDKQRVGDNRTPTGDFRIVSIENASGWTHDFRDGKGKIRGAYGPWFFRLDAKGWKGIGIHGTHAPDSIGTNATEGCIRLHNEDLAELKTYAYRNMPVVIREN